MLGQEHEHPPAITIPPVPAQTYIHHTTLSPRPKIILIGDSITELGSSDPQGWVASLAIRYNRRADVANRGMNGYNSRWGLAALPLILEEMMGPQSAAAAAAFSLLGDCCDGGASDTQIITNTDSNGEQCLQDNQAAASEKQKQQHSHPQYTFIIGYGANDSCLPESGYSRHHVPLEEYSSNLKSMIQIIQTWSAEKTVAVALLTPPPANTEVLKGSRDNENVTKLYAEACIHLASEMGVPVVDVWTGMQLPISKGRDEGKTSSFESNQQWKTDYLSDGHGCQLPQVCGVFVLFWFVLDNCMIGKEDIRQRACLLA